MYKSIIIKVWFWTRNNSIIGALEIQNFNLLFWRWEFILYFNHHFRCFGCILTFENKWYRQTIKNRNQGTWKHHLLSNLETLWLWDIFIDFIWDQGFWVDANYVQHGKRDIIFPLKYHFTYLSFWLIF